MQKLLLFILSIISCCAGTYAQSYLAENIITSTLITNDFVYEPSADKIYAITASNSVQHPNSLAIINPHSNTVENALSLESEPTSMAISDDGQYIYLGFMQLPIIKRFSVATNSVDMDFEMGVNNIGSPTPYYARNIDVAPGQNNIIAVARCDYDGNASGAAIYESGVIKPEDSGATSITHIKFTDQNTLYTYCTYCGPAYLRAYTVIEGGLTLLGAYQDMPSVLWLGLETLHFTYYNNKFYFNHGKVVELSPTPNIDGTLENVIGGGITYDQHTNLICSADETWQTYVDDNGYSDGWRVKILRFNPDDYSLYDSFYIKDDWAQDVDKIITCGEGCYALSTSVWTSNGTLKKFHIVREEALGASQNTNKSVISLYPNPSTDFITVNGIDITGATVYDIQGKVILNFKVTNNKLDIRNLAQGLYLVKLTDQNNNIYTEKIIKR